MYNIGFSKNEKYYNKETLKNMTAFALYYY